MKMTTSRKALVALRKERWPLPVGDIPTFNGTACILWPGVPNRNRYGDLLIDGVKIKAHRAIYINHFGKIPAGLVLDHLCRNIRCVNPSHMEVVTQKENVYRGVGVAAINHMKTHCVRGHELSGYNLKIATRPDGRKRRVCVACERHRTRLCTWRDRLRAQVQHR